MLGERLGTGAVLRARRYTWARAAHLLREIYAELTVGSPRRVLVTDRWSGILGDAERQAVCQLIDDWAAGELATEGALVAVDRQTGGRPGDRRPALVSAAARGREGIRDGVAHLAAADPASRDAIHAGSRDQHRATWEYLLKRNADLLGMSFALGPEDAVYLVGRVPVERVDDEELDRVIGASLAYTDECFPTAMTLGYEGRYRRRPPAAVGQGPATGQRGPLVAFRRAVGSWWPHQRRRAAGRR